MNGYILIHRRLIDWEWYSNINDTRLWIHCLLKANWKKGYFDGKEIERGSFVTSYEKLAYETGLTFSQVRKSLEHLKKTKNITITRHSKYSIISIENYDKYQTETQSDDKHLTNTSQSDDNNRNNTNKEKKKNNNNIYVEIIDYLNLKTGQNYKYNNKSTQKHINERLAEGFTVDDFKTVIDKMCVEWINTDMQKYLRPDTLFRPSKFESYLNRKNIKEELPSWFDKEPQRKDRTNEWKELAEQLTKGTYRP